MYYVGKYQDTFDAAFSQLLAYVDCPPVPFIDCLSLRCFGFRVEGPVGTWFRPFISLPDAFSALSEALGVGIHYKTIHSVAELPDWCSGMLLGPLKSSIAVLELRDYYYHGAGRFVFVQRNIEGALIVFDPHGFAGLPLSTRQMDELLGDSELICAWLSDYEAPMAMHSPENILLRGLNYHHSVAKEEAYLIEQACGSYLGGAQNGLSLQYGVQELLQQLDKVFTLATHCGWDVEKEYLDAKQVLYACGLNRTVSGLSGAIQHVWGILDDER